jgi:LmbE family N-acetylglucosaminyl deacetylase
MSPATDTPEGRSIVVLSPHFDDAVFSAWHVLTAPADVRVVTVFGAIPEPGFVTPLDRSHGAAESAEWVRKRRADDRAALALAGREPTHVDLLDAEYRAHQIPTVREAIERDPRDFIPLVAQDEGVHTSVEELDHELRRFVEGDVIVYAPAGIGGHPDHRDVARFGVRLAEEGRAVRLYGDTPYFMRHGLPSWLTEVENRRADEYVEKGLRALSAAPRRLERDVVELSAGQVERKIAAARRYETEFDFVNADFGGVAEDRDAMRYEVCWTQLAEGATSAAR